MQITVGDICLHCELLGSGEPLLLVHGFPLRGELWHAVASRLRDWRCIIPDLRGHGRSSVTPAVSIAQFADDLAMLLDALGEHRPVVFCGLSLGGVIAFEFFRRYRSRLRALVLVDCRADAESVAGREQRAALAQRVLVEGSSVAAAAMVGRLFSPVAPPELKARWQGYMCATAPEGIAATARALADRPDSTATLRHIDLPTLLVFGADDEITPPAVGRQMQASIAGARLEVIAGAGHLPPVERPEEFAAVLASFLECLPPCPVLGGS